MPDTTKRLGIQIFTMSLEMLIKKWNPVLVLKPETGFIFLATGFLIYFSFNFCQGDYIKITKCQIEIHLLKINSHII